MENVVVCLLPKVMKSGGNSYPSAHFKLK